MFFVTAYDTKFYVLHVTRFRICQIRLLIKGDEHQRSYRKWAIIV